MFFQGIQRINIVKMSVQSDIKLKTWKVKMKLHFFWGEYALAFCRDYPHGCHTIWWLTVLGVIFSLAILNVKFQSFLIFNFKIPTSTFSRDWHRERPWKKSWKEQWNQCIAAVFWKGQCPMGPCYWQREQVTIRKPQWVIFQLGANLRVKLWRK